MGSGGGVGGKTVLVALIGGTADEAGAFGTIFSGIEGIDKDISD